MYFTKLEWTLLSKCSNLLAELISWRQPTPLCLSGMSYQQMKVFPSSHLLFPLFFVVVGLTFDIKIGVRIVFIYTKNISISQWIKICQWKWGISRIYRLLKWFFLSLVSMKSMRWSLSWSWRVLKLSILSFRRIFRRSVRRISL